MRKDDCETCKREHRTVCSSPAGPSETGLKHQHAGIANNCRWSCHVKVSWTCQSWKYWSLCSDQLNSNLRWCPEEASYQCAQRFASLLVLLRLNKSGLQIVKQNVVSSPCDPPITQDFYCHLTSVEDSDFNLPRRVSVLPEWHS